MNTSIVRCPWPGINKPHYEKYHDTEWAVPVHDDRLLFEMLILEGAQAGLTWETVLKRREEYKKLFYNFDPHTVSTLSDLQLEEILKNPGIIRNRLKVFGTRTNARVFLAIQKEYGSFDAYLWSFLPDAQPRMNYPSSMKELISRSPISDAISKDLKKRGMTFVGSTIIYAYMQAIGMVNDHLTSCSFKNKY